MSAINSMLATPWKQRVRNLIILVVLVMLVKGCSMLYGYAIVIDYPTEAFLTENGEIRAEGVRINGKTIQMENWTWKIELAKPKSWLQGVGKISIIPDLDLKESIVLVVKYCSSISSIQQRTTNLDVDEFAVALRVITDDTYYESAWSEEALKCIGITGMPVVERAPVGTLHIDRFLQGAKRLVLQGDMSDVKATLCHANTCNPSKPEESLLLEIDKLTFSIDSPVIYKWSNKAGKTWKL